MGLGLEYSFGMTMAQNFMGNCKASCVVILYFRKEEFNCIMFAKGIIIRCLKYSGLVMSSVANGYMVGIIMVIIDWLFRDNIVIILLTNKSLIMVLEQAIIKIQLFYRG